MSNKTNKLFILKPPTFHSSSIARTRSPYSSIMKNYASKGKKRKDGANSNNDNKNNNNNNNKNKKVKHTMKFAPSRGLKPSQSQSKLYATTQELLECEISDVRRILSEAFSPDRPDALRADPRAFTMFSTRLRKQKQWEKCVEVFNLQKLLGVERNTISFNAVMSAAIKGGNPKYALDLFAEMKKMGLDITTITINVAMQAYLKLNEPNKALELFDALEEKNDTVSLNTAMAAAEMAGDEDRLAQLRSTTNSKVERIANESEKRIEEEGEGDSSSSSSSSSSDEEVEEEDDDDDDDVDEDDDEEEEEEEERRLRMKKLKKKQQKEEEEEMMRKKILDAGTNDEDDPDLALRKRRDARRKKFEEKRRLRKLKKGKERQWTSAAAHAKQAKSELQLKRSQMKGNPKDWLNEGEESSSSDKEDEEESDTETRMKKWREKVQRKGFKSAIEDEKIDKYINVHSSSHGMDSEDFWKAGF